MTENIAPISFRILKFCGLWRPLAWSTWKIILYSAYSGLILIILTVNMIFISIAVGNIPITDEIFSENVFLMFAMINAIFKSTNVLVCRERFIKMMSMAHQKRWRNFENKEENEIREKYNKTIRKMSIYFTSAVFVAILMRIVKPLLEVSEVPRLPVKAYCPCDILDSDCYWAMYWLQAIGISVATLIHTAKDSLISALLLQICFQLNIVKHRLLNLTKLCANADYRDQMPNCILSTEKNLIAQCVRDHESIFKFFKLLNESLSVMLFGQISMTLPNLCLSIYLLSAQSITSINFMMTFQFLSAVVIELFFFCWYGNEVTLNSVNVGNVLNEIDWTKLSIISKKDLSMLVQRTRKPILFSIGPIMNLNIRSFLSIMKTSYSAFSVLKSRE